MKKLIIISLILVLFSPVTMHTSCTEPRDFDNSFWSLSKLNGEEILQDTYISIYFNNGKFGGYGGCNTYGGDYSSEETGSIKIINLFNTVLGGPEETIAQEKACTTALRDAVSYTISGNTLTLYNSDKEKILVFQYLKRFDMNPANLVDTKWHLISINDTAIPDDLQITLNFSSNSTAFGHSGVFKYYLNYKAKGDILECGIRSGKEGEDTSEHELYAVKYLSAIGGKAHRYNMGKTRLEIYNLKGDTLAFKIASD